MDYSLTLTEERRDDTGSALPGGGADAAASLRAGQPFSLLLDDDDERRAATLDALLDRVADHATRFAHATNPLRARLTLERLLIQALNGPADPFAAPAELIRAIAQRRGDERRVILVIERAETLCPDALQFLTSTAPMFSDAEPRLQILFAGRREFASALDDPVFGHSEPPIGAEPFLPGAPEPLDTPVPLDPAEAMVHAPAPADDVLGGPAPEGRTRRVLTRICIAGGLAVGVAAVVFAATLALTSPPNVAVAERASAALDDAAPGGIGLDPPVLPGDAPADEATAGLRREFDAYLAASGKNLDGASAAQRRNAYSEFLVWRARTARRP